jgi:predicted  nucleic acid-binding Zn-ribbon protein
MDAGEFDRLMSEAIAECDDLAGAAEDASQVLERLRNKADALAEVLGREADEAHGHFQQITSRLESAEDDLEQRGTEIGTVLDGIETRAQEVQERTTQARDAVGQALTELAERRDAVATGLQTEVTEAQEALQALGRQIEAASDDLDDRLRALGTRESQLTEAVDEALGEIEEKASAWTGGLEDLERVGVERSQAYLAGVGALIHSQTSLLVDFCNRMVTEHNEAVVALRQQFAERAAARVAEAAAPLRAALEALAELCEHEHEVITQRAQLAVDQAGEVGDLVDKVAQLFPAGEKLAER